MNKVLLGLVIVAAAGFGVWKLVLSPASGGDKPGGTPAGEREAPADPGLQGAVKGPAREVPKDQPPPEWFPVEQTLRVLFLVDAVTSWPAQFAVALNEHEGKIVSDAWCENPVPQAPQLGPAVTMLAERPTAGTFVAERYEVLVLVGCDPTRFADEFWKVVGERVKEGRLGLWVCPSTPPVPKGTSVRPAVHPMLTHPALAALLPVEEAERMEGRPDPKRPGDPPRVPGSFAEGAPFVVTDAGITHPASRFVSWPTWSRRIWADGGSGLQPWGSLFVYPVTKLRPGAVTLVNAVPSRGAPIPMYVQGAPASGRVLWFGAFDFGEATYRNNLALEKWVALLRNSVVWLAGRAPVDEN